MKRYTIDEIYSKQNKKEKNKKIKRTIVIILIIPLLIYNMVLLYQILAQKSSTPHFFGYKTFTIISGSMKPKLNIGDIVVIKEVENEDLEVGDIISFKEQSTGVITHRIVRNYRCTNISNKRRCKQCR